MTRAVLCLVYTIGLHNRFARLFYTIGSHKEVP